MFHWKLEILGFVIRKPVNAKPGLKVNQRVNLSYIKLFFIAYVLFSWSLVKFKNEGQKTSLKSYRTQIKILANPELA